MRAYLEYFISNKTILTLIWKFSHSGILDKDIYTKTLKGAPQGGPLSPVLANIYLNMLDIELEKRGHRFNMQMTLSFSLKVNEQEKE